MRVKLDRPERPDWCCHEHHVFNGTANRKHSEKYNCVIYVRPDMHERIHKDVVLRKQLKAVYQRKLEDAGWTREEFISTFGRSYVD